MFTSPAVIVWFSWGSHLYCRSADGSAVTIIVIALNHHNIRNRDCFPSSDTNNKTDNVKYKISIYFKYIPVEV